MLLINESIAILFITCLDWIFNCSHQTNNLALIYRNKYYQKLIVNSLAVTSRLAVNTQFSSNYPVTSFNFIGIVVYFIFCFTVIGLVILV